MPIFALMSYGLENTIKFLKQLGQTRKQQLIEKATEWELKMHQHMENLDYVFEFQHPVICDIRKPEKRKPETLKGECLKLYILDFYLPDYKMAIELDGWSVHGSNRAKAKDRQRTRHLGYHKIKVLRLSNAQITTFTLKEIDLIIKKAIKSKL